jgi:hypothetical protein
MTCLRQALESSRADIKATHRGRSRLKGHGGCQQQRQHGNPPPAVGCCQPRRRGGAAAGCGRAAAEGAPAAAHQGVQVTCRYRRQTGRTTGEGVVLRWGASSNALQRVIMAGYVPAGMLGPTSACCQCNVSNTGERQPPSSTGHVDLPECILAMHIAPLCTNSSNAHGHSSSSSISSRSSSSSSSSSSISGNRRASSNSRRDCHSAVVKQQETGPTAWRPALHAVGRGGSTG